MHDNIHDVISIVVEPEIIRVEVESMLMLEYIMCYKRIFPPIVVMAIINFILMSISSVNYITSPIIANLIFLTTVTVLCCLFSAIGVWIYITYEYIEEITMENETIEIHSIP